MSYANGTTHYNLPQTVGTDKRDWSDTNQAFADVDAALYGAATAASGAATDVAALTTRVGTLETSMGAAQTDIATLQASDTQQDTSILALGTDKQDKTDNSLTTTSKQVVGAINELNMVQQLSNDTLVAGDTCNIVSGCKYVAINLVRTGYSSSFPFFIPRKFLGSYAGSKAIEYNEGMCSTTVSNSSIYVDSVTTGYTLNVRQFG